MPGDGPLRSPVFSAKHQSSVAALPESERFKLAALIFDELTASAGATLDFSDSWSAYFATIRDGAANTIMVVEANADRAVIWTKPDDLEIDLNKPHDGLGDIHPKCFLAVFVDGHTSLDFHHTD